MAKRKTVIVQLALRGVYLTRIAESRRDANFVKRLKSHYGRYTLLVSVTRGKSALRPEAERSAKTFGKTVSFGLHTLGQ